MPGTFGEELVSTDEESLRLSLSLKGVLAGMGFLRLLLLDFIFKPFDYKKLTPSGLFMKSAIFFSRKLD